MLLTGRDQMAVCISFPGFCNVHIPLQHSHLTWGLFCPGYITSLT